VVKRSLIAIGALLLLYLCYTLFAALLAGGPEEPKRPKKQPAEAQPWPGKGTHVLNTTLYRRDAALAVDRAEFTGLKLKKATVRVQLRADLSSGRPKWLRPRSFFGYRYVSRQRFRAQVDESVSGTTDKITLTFRGVPTAALGPTCTSPSRPADPFFLRMPGLPGGEVAVAVTAPPAPAGACLADPETIAAAERARLLATRAVAVSRVSVNGKRITVRGRVTAAGLAQASIELGRRGKFPRSKRIRARRGPFTVRLRAPGKGRFRLRATVVDGDAGRFHPRAAMRSVRVR